MSRYRGNVSQSTLDWYAGRAQSAQQWFSQAALNYWAFTLQNNAADGTRLWVYDAETVSGAAFPAGTGNPGGNPNSIAGYQGGANKAASWALVSQSVSELNNVNSLAVTAPASIVAGNLILVAMFCGNFAASFIKAPDNTWALIGSVDGNANSPAVAVFGHIATGSEPASWTFVTTGAAAFAMIGEAFQLSGGANPGFIDAGVGQVSATPSVTITAPAITTSTAGDMLIAIWVDLDNPDLAPPSLPAGFTNLVTRVGYSHRLRIADLLPAVGGAGPFNATQGSSFHWSALTLALKPSNLGAAPGQSLSAPIQSVSPLAPGIVTLNFSVSPISLGGITRWLPPGSHFEWHREAPLAIIDPNTNFNLAGISPEAAAWGSLTWLAIK